MRTALKRSLMWLVCRAMWLKPVVDWAFKLFDLKGL
ncbi:hypothetical protein J2793_007385 [Paraburkholderia caledonica]|jgi:hypothetical protein|uniref:Uncharacterized protein n=1 Tax=Paraburkholderia caledonica TaxID=134536 RepID=A0AB73IPG3_9BURK|nr:hypothetical protein [Paraburkholderia caledonica]